MTDKRKEAFEKARIKRQENLLLKKKQKEEEELKYKQELENKLLLKAKKLAEKKIKKQKILDEIVSDYSESEEEYVVKKRKPKQIALEKPVIKHLHPKENITIPTLCKTVPKLSVGSVDNKLLTFISSPSIGIFDISL